MKIKLIKISEGYMKDGRKPIIDLYNSYFKLLKQRNKWKVEEIFLQKVLSKKTLINLPILGFSTKTKGKALWIISGIHGEEPAGPNAIANKIKEFIRLEKIGIPIVLIPLANPRGYFKNYRYPYDSRKCFGGKSIGDSEHILIDIKNPKSPRKIKPSLPDSDALTKFIVNTSKDYPPLLVIDLHEDLISEFCENPFYRSLYNDLGETYIYSQGKLGKDDPIAKEIVKIMLNKKHPIKISGRLKTRFGEEVVNGIVSGIKDGSVDELLASKKIFFNNKLIKGPNAKSVVVVETLAGDPRHPYKKRLIIHSKIIKSLKRFWKIVNRID